MKRKEPFFSSPLFPSIILNQWYLQSFHCYQFSLTTSLSISNHLFFYFTFSLHLWIYFLISYPWFFPFYQSFSSYFTFLNHLFFFCFSHQSPTHRVSSFTSKALHLLTSLGFWGVDAVGKLADLLLLIEVFLFPLGGGVEYRNSWVLAEEAELSFWANIAVTSSLVWALQHKMLC